MITKKIGEICKISSGGTPSRQNNEYYENGTIKWIKTGDLKNKNLYDASEFITEDALNNSSAKLFPPETVLIAMYGATIGACSILKTEAATNQACAALFPSESYIPEFMYYYITFRKNDIVSKAVGGAQPNISAGFLKEYEIPLPPLETQKKIVEALDKAQALIDAKKEQIRLMDELLKSRFVEMFGEKGAQVKLTDYVWFQEGPGVRSTDFVNRGFILLTGSNINNNEISFGNKSDRFISEELANGKYSHFICDQNDILVVSSAIAPENFDKKVVVVKEDSKYCLNTGIIRFKPNREYVTTGYFREFLKTGYFKNQVIGEMRGIAQMHFGPSHLKNMTIILPNSIKEQEEFEKFVNKVDESKLEMQKNLDELTTTQQALMQLYFG